MSLQGSLSIASSGLLAIQGQIDVVSQNVSNANTSGYVAETAANVAVQAGSVPAGVRIGAATRIVAPALQTSLYAQNAGVSSASILSASWSRIVSALGSTDASTGSTGSLTEGLANLQTAFTTLESDQTNTVGRSAVVAAGQDLASRFNALAGTLATSRQDAENGLGDDLATANQALAEIGATSSEITRLRTSGQSSASVEDQRDAAMTTLSNVLDVKFTETSSGDMLVSTPNGIILPTDPAQGTLSMAAATLGPADSYPATIPGIMLGGLDVTKQLGGGSLGAHLTLRDTDIPAAQSSLDGLAVSVAQAFHGQGLDLFADGGGNVPQAVAGATPPAGQLGYAAAMQVNPAVAGTPSLVATGTGAPASGGSFSVAGVVTGSFSGRGSAPSVFDGATALSAQWGARAQSAASDLTNSSAAQASIASAITNVSGVSIDAEMSKMVALQNSYTANAKIIAAVQSMFSSILNAVDP